MGGRGNDRWQLLRHGAALMGALSALMLTEFQKASPHWLPLLTLSTPGETIRLASAGCGASSRSEGPHEALVSRWGRHRMAAEDDRYGLETPERTIEIVDRDRRWSKLVAANPWLQGSLATERLASRNVPAASWYTSYVGRLYAWPQTAPDRYELVLRPRDIELSAVLAGPVLREGDWPLIDKAQIGKTAALLWGSHDSSSGSYLGAVTCPCVDTSAWKYVVCFGRAKSVPRVWLAGVLKTVTTHYTVTYPAVNGRTWTMITFVSPTSGAEVRCDVDGYGAGADGAGALIQTPGAMILHALANWTYARSDGGTWYTTNAAVDDAALTALDATIANAASGAPVHAAWRIDSETTMHEMLAGVCGTYGWHPFFQGDGRLSFGAPDPFVVAYPTDRLRPGDYASQPAWGYADRDSTRAVSATYGTEDAGSKDSLRVADPFVQNTYEHSMPQDAGMTFAR